jgi:hypothetical protein
MIGSLWTRSAGFDCEPSYRHSRFRNTLSGVHILTLMQPSPVQIVDSWMKENGYALEASVAKTLCSTAWKPSMAANIAGRQPDDVPRDVDVLAKRCVSRPDVLGKLVAYLLIECKYVVPSQPWVLLHAVNLHETKGLPQYIPRSSARSAPPAMLGVPVIEQRSEPPNSAINRVVSCGLKCAGKTTGSGKQKDPTFESLSKVKELAWSLAAKAQTFQGEATFAKEVIVIPCLVVKGPLTRVRFGDGGSFEVEEVTSGAVLSCTPPESTLIHVVRDTYFAEFVTKLNSDVERWADYILPAAPKIYTKRAARSKLREESPRPASPTTRPT